MRHTLFCTAAAAAMLAAGGAALAGDGTLLNRGLIDQAVNVQGTLTMLQDESISSTQAVNMVAADKSLTNEGTIKQAVSAATLTMTQSKSIDSTQAVNLVRAGTGSALGTAAGALQ